MTRWISDCFGGGEAADVQKHVVEILGPGCDKCDQLYRNVIQAVGQVGLEKRFAVRKRQDIGYFREMGVAITPGLVIDGKVISKGKVLSRDQVVAHLHKTSC